MQLHKFPLKIYSTFLIFDPPFPIMFLWNCLKIGTETEKLFSTWRKETQKMNTELL